MQDSPELILEPADLEPMLGQDKLLIVDLCQPGVWRQLHIPGAVHVDPAALTCGLPPAPGKLPTVQQLETLLGRIGYSPECHVVAYDDEGGGWAGRFLWTLDVIGHSRYSYLNGGLHAWYREGHPVSAEVLPPTETTVNINIDSGPIAELDTVLGSLKDPQIKIWDARSAEEYAGLRSGSARAGHIPGAINLDWLELMDRNRNLRLLPLPALRAKLAAIGIAPEHRIITHCQSHHRSGLSYLVAKALGHSVQAYHGSWGEWGNRQDVPIGVLA